MTRPRAAQAGFTLVELAVATVILMFAILIASEMLDQSGRLLQHSVRRAQDPYTLLPRELLRNDIRAAVPPAGAAGSPQHGELWLQGAGGPVVWSVDASGRLVRTANGVSHAYLSRVRRFTWTLWPGPRGEIVEVSVEYHTSGLYLHQAAGSLPRSDPGEEHELHVAMVARLGARAW